MSLYSVPEIQSKKREKAIMKLHLNGSFVVEGNYSQLIPLVHM
jgi:hypothetical protein